MGILGWDRLGAETEARISDSIVNQRALPSPISLELQPTNRCNVDCFFCSARRYRNDEFIEWPRLEAQLRHAAAHGLRFIRLSGGGESLIYPKLRSLLDLMGELGLRLSDLTTNATPLAPYAEHIGAVGLDIASISMNEATEELYAQTMQSPARMYEKALEGIRALIAVRDNAAPDDRPYIQLKFMFHRRNFHTLPQMLALARELRADHVLINHLWGLKPGERLQPEEVAAAREILPGVIADDMTSGRPLLAFNLGPEGDLQQVADREISRHLTVGTTAAPARGCRTKYCLMGWYHTTVSATGLVYPCCNFVGLPGKDVGNLATQTLEEIWHGEPYEQFRREFRWMMVMKGQVNSSRKLHRYLEPGCIAENECPFAWGLASDPFYAELAERMDREVGTAERTAATVRQGLIATAQKSRRLLGV